MAVIIELENLSFHYPYPQKNGLDRGDGGKKLFSSGAYSTKGRKYNCNPKKIIFENFFCKIKEGATMVVNGRSGSGKTTLLRLLAWLEEPHSGRALLNGKAYNNYYPPDLRKIVGMVQQKPVMLDGTTFENMILGAAEPPSRDVLSGWLDMFNLDDDLLDQPAHLLSVGQQHRVAVIRTLITNPRLLLLDEPTAGLDPESTKLFVTAIKTYADKHGLTTVWVSHDLDAVRSIATDTLTLRSTR